MGEFLHWLTETPEGGSYGAAILIGGIGAFFYIMNWGIFINNRIPGRKWSSMVPPLGGLLIALAFILFIPVPWKWLALIGVTDPIIFVVVYSVIKPPERRPEDDVNNEKDKEETDENGKHSD